MKSLILLALALGLSVNAHAAEKRRSNVAPQRSAAREMTYHRMAGCGLGSQVIEDNSKWSQVGASLLNGTGMQSFAISFGTSGCTEDGAVTASREKEAFVESNLADLRSDVAAGEGEYLASLASLYGCKGANAAAFRASLAQSKDRLFQDEASVGEALAITDQAATVCRN